MSENSGVPEPLRDEVMDGASLLNSSSVQVPVMNDHINAHSTIEMLGGGLEDPENHISVAPDPCQSLESNPVEVSATEIASSMECVDDISKKNHTFQREVLPEGSCPTLIEENSVSLESTHHILENDLQAKGPESNGTLMLSVNSDVDNVSSCKDRVEESAMLCRLCAVPCQDSALISLFQHPPHHPEALPKDVVHQSGQDDILSMIKETLPIKVSCCDKLPKQVCKSCVERLRLAHAFSANVLRAESQLISLRNNQGAGYLDEEINHNSYDCPTCKEIPMLLAKQLSSIQSKSCSWEKINVKLEPQDAVEPSHEELEKSYHDFFGGQKDFETFKTEERVTLKPSKPAYLGGRRPRGRPRSRPHKVTPRGRRGRRSVQTTVERILELSEASQNDDYGFRIRSKEGNPASEALTQCMLCEQWLHGAAGCLQHSLSTHMDSGAFLCPRCPRDDFPGDFELIQHYQESHCPDLELYEVLHVERNVAHSSHSTQYRAQVEAEPPMEREYADHSAVKEEDVSRETEAAWSVEAMDYEILNNTPPNELYESQDEVSSNLSEIAPRSLTSHSAVYEEESNSLSTHGSDSNLASEHVPLHDKMIGEASSMVDGVPFSDSPRALVVGDFTSDLRAMEDESQEDNKLMDKQGLENTQNTTNITIRNEEKERNDYKPLQEDSQGSQDSLKTDDLCGFQEAINEKSQEVNLNGSAIQFDSDLASSTDQGDISSI